VPQRTGLPLARAGGPALGALRVAAAGAFILALSYVLSWPFLYDGLQGIDYLWHWHLASWVSTEFPGLPFWNRWDLSGVPYRDLYPILPHWLAIAVSRLLRIDVSSGIQLVQFAVTPLLALGLYAFCDWRWKRPLVGLVAAVLFLIDPLSWVETIDYMWFASQLGVVFFMPALIALDWYFALWSAKAAGWQPRLAAFLFVVLSAATGAISPAALSAPILVMFAYVLAARRDTWWRWLVGPAALMTVAIIGLQLFWIGPFFGFLSYVGQRANALVFNPSLVTTFDIRRLLELLPIRATLDVDRFSLSPAVWLPAAFGLLLALRHIRARVPAALSLLGIGLLSVQWLYYPMALVPSAGVFVEALYRPAAIQLRFFVPLLGALALVGLPEAAIAWLAKKVRLPGRRLARAAAVLATLAIVFADVAAFAGHIDGWPDSLAYGPGFEGTYSAHGPDIRDLWMAHTDQCRNPSPPYPACSSAALTSAFSVTELAAACASADGTPRSDVEICTAIGPDLSKPRWAPASDPLIATTDAWCSGRTDPVCAARFDPLWRQLLDPSLWRPPMVGCHLAWCHSEAARRDAFSGYFSRPPDRLAVQGEVQPLAAAAHELTGGASAGTIAVGGGGAEPSRDLYQFVENEMLKQRGVEVKRQLAAITGIDAVALGPNQAGQASDYTALGWQKTSDQPLAYQDPSPSGLATEWPGGNAVLVVGASQTGNADVYNAVFKRSASGGMIPFAGGWLVRGSSPYIDDYSPSDLAKYGTIVLWGYRYRAHDMAWGRLSQWVQAGGHLFVETGWQFVDPDWSGGAMPDVLPVTSAAWGGLDVSAPAVIGSGSAAQSDPAFGDLHYQGGAWGASSAAVSALRPGAEAVVSVGGRVVVARATLGSGRVLWSGMNLLAHATTTGSASEDALIRSQFDWLLPPAVTAGSGASPAAAANLAPAWSGNEAVTIPLVAASEPTLVLFKESQFPGWSADLVSAGARQPVAIIDSEYDYMMVRLDSVPAGSRLEFTYRPPWTEVAAWVASAVSLVLILVWLLRPGFASTMWEAVGGKLSRAWRGRLQSYANRWESDES
jgi:hypothetical protein